MDKLPHRVVHYGANDPDRAVGGVETFARGLRTIFEDVTFMTPATLDVALVERERLPVVCDNHHVLDWPAHIPVIGFQHGVAANKFRATRNLGAWVMSLRQRRAAQRANVLWVACATWIGRTFAALHGNSARHVVCHPIDVERFDGRRSPQPSPLVLHDARRKHKGSTLIPRLAAAFPQWRFEPLDCAPADVPDRMRKAAMFVHLSRYEGNSIVCLEAMAMNLPCFFTRVGLMQEDDGPDDVCLIEPRDAFGRSDALERAFGAFAASLGHRAYRPRDWILRHATPEAARREMVECHDGLRGAPRRPGRQAAAGFHRSCRGLTSV